MRQCCDGREKYSNLLVNWMELERTTLHEVDSPTHKEWSQIEKRVSFSLSDATRSVIVTSLMRAVFNRCQQAVVSFKGETLLLEGEQCDADDEFVEARLDIDEACLSFGWLCSPLPSKLTQPPQSQQNSSTFTAS